MSMFCQCFVWCGRGGGTAASVLSLLFTVHEDDIWGCRMPLTIGSTTTLNWLPLQVCTTRGFGGVVITSSILEWQRVIATSCDALAARPDSRTVTVVRPSAVFRQIRQGCIVAHCMVQFAAVAKLASYVLQQQTCYVTTIPQQRKCRTGASCACGLFRIMLSSW